MNEKEYIDFMVSTIKYFKDGGIPFVNNYLTFNGFDLIPKDLESGYLIELEKVWIITTFWKDEIYDLMGNGMLLCRKLLGFVKDLIEPYKLNGKNGLKQYIEDNYSLDEEIHTVLLDMIENLCKMRIKAVKYTDSLPHKYIICDGKKEKIYDAYLIYNFIDTDLSYDDWVEQNKELLFEVE